MNMRIPVIWDSLLGSPPHVLTLPSGLAKFETYAAVGTFLPDSADAVDTRRKIKMG